MLAGFLVLVFVTGLLARSKRVVRIKESVDWLGVIELLYLLGVVLVGIVVIIRVLQPPEGAVQSFVVGGLLGILISEFAQSKNTSDQSVRNSWYLNLYESGIGSITTRTVVLSVVLGVALRLAGDHPFGSVPQLILNTIGVVSAILLYGVLQMYKIDQKSD